MSTKTEQEKLNAAKAQAKESVGKKVKKTVDTITFKKNSQSGIVFEVLQRAKKPLTLQEITERALKAGAKKESRVKTVADWFAGNGLAIKKEGKYELMPSEVTE